MLQSISCCYCAATAWLSIFTLNRLKMTGAGGRESNGAGEGAEFKKVIVLAGGRGESARREGQHRGWQRLERGKAAEEMV